MNYWETEERYDTPGKRADELRREQEQMRDEYHRMEERVAELEYRCGVMLEALKECEVDIDNFIDAEKPRGVHPKWDSENTHLKELNPARLALQEAGDEQ